MATPAQIAANQANAQKSTGPRSEEGKQVSKMNAVTNGIFTTVPIAEVEDEDEFERMSEELTAIYQPSDYQECILVENIIISLWRQKRVRLAESARINLANSDHQVMQEVNRRLNLSTLNSLHIDQISGDLSSEYQSLLVMKKELDNMDFEKKSHYPSTIKNDAPNVYSQLSFYTKKHNMTWENFLSKPICVKSALEELNTSIEESIKLIQIRINGKKISLITRRANLVVDEKYCNLLMKYETRAENAYIKAVDALEKYRKSRLKVVEGELMNQ